MAKRLGGRGNFPKEIKLFEMKDKPYEGYYLRSEFVSNDKVEGSVIHIFGNIDGSTEKEESIWGFGALDFVLLSEKVTKEAKAKLDNGSSMESKIETGTPLRIIYKGMKQGKVRIGKKTVTKDLHDVEVFDITEDIEK